MLSVRVGEAYCLVAATGSDADNVYIALTVRGLNPSLRIVARASRADAEDKLHRARRRHGHLAVRHRRATHGAIGH